MKSLIRFIQRFQFFLLFLLLEGISLSCVVRYGLYQGDKLSGVLNEFSGGLFGGYNHFTDYFNLRENNQRLSAENARLRQQIEQSYVKYDRKLFQVHDTTYRLQYEYVEAKVTSNSVVKRNNYIMINKGANHGIEPGMAVISSDGVVGIVKVVSRNYSSILSALHGDSRISSRIQWGISTGSVVWDGSSSRYGSMEDVPSHFEIKIGDTVVTSGYSLNFPEGVPVGYVTEVNTKTSDNFHKIQLRFATNFNTLDYVYVVRNLSKDEQMQLVLKQSENE